MSRRALAARADGTPRRVGRRPLLTPEVEDTFLTAVRNGAPLKRAALAAGVSDRTVLRWIARGEDEEQRLAALAEEYDDPQHPEHGQEPATDPVEEPFRRFCQRTAHARAEAMTKALGYLDTAARGGFVTKEKTKTWYEDGEQVTETETSYAGPEWRAAAWLLEHSFASEFGKAAESLDVRLSGPDGGPVQVQDATVNSLAQRLSAVLDARRQEALEGPVDHEGHPVVDGQVVDKASA